MPDWSGSPENSVMAAAGQIFLGSGGKKYDLKYANAELELDDINLDTRGYRTYGSDCSKKSELNYLIMFSPASYLIT